MINKERLVERFMRYVQIDSPTKEEREFALILKKELEELGLEVVMDDAGEKAGSNSGNLIARLKGNAKKETILFSSHMDTVSPSRGIKPKIVDGTIYSDGTTILGGDDKAGVASIMEALQVIKEENLPHGDLEIAFSIFEEGGLFGSKNLDYSKIVSKIGFVLDSGGDPGDIIVQGPAQNKIDVKFIGLAAHAGVAPEAGISAIQMVAEAISNMRLLRIDEETTANIGDISGGGATNIVAKEVIFHAEARSLDNEKLQVQSDHMVKCCEDAAKKFGGKVEVSVENAYGAFNIPVDHPAVKAVEEACRKLEIPTRTTTSGGGSDTNIFNANGVAAINLGIGERKPHTLEEHLHIIDLYNTARIVVELMRA
ncbi:MAG TPA: M20/M25/M40 family metallo-hydrolase [Proteiniclasticum sp.]|nr:M20/M25/M40 family metallo-hydrolase [Proteiniclasticum sp.]